MENERSSLPARPRRTSRPAAALCGIVTSISTTSGLCSMNQSASCAFAASSTGSMSASRSSRRGGLCLHRERFEAGCPGSRGGLPAPTGLNRCAACGWSSRRYSRGLCRDGWSARCERQREVDGLIAGRRADRDRARHRRKAGQLGGHLIRARGEREAIRAVRVGRRGGLRNATAFDQYLKRQAAGRCR